MQNKTFSHSDGATKDDAATIQESAIGAPSAITRDAADGFVWINGRIVPPHQAVVSVFDRGFLFADGVYEVSAIIDGHLVDNDNHLRRLERSLSEIQLPGPWTLSEISAAQQALVARNNIREGLLYLQITRGPAPRDFAFPSTSEPTLVMFTRATNIVGNPLAETGIKVISIDEIRWKRRDIKSIALLAQALGKQQAVAAGAQEAWMVEAGLVTEGTSSNAYIIDSDGRIVTRPATHHILRGITRQAVLALIEEQRLTLEERPFSLTEAFDAREAFITSATTFVLPVVSLDGKTIGAGEPGPITRRLREIYIEAARSQRL